MGNFDRVKVGFKILNIMPKKELPKAYEPDKYEEAIYKNWEESGYFQPKADQDNPDNLLVEKGAKNYSIVMPPPNRTGVLHMGHAAMLAIEDILIRYHRMLGERTLWVPGTDHAAIATQTKVEKMIKKEGSDRHKMGKEKFLERVREFAKNSHDTIVSQIKKMGCSCDWSREAYTLDEARSKAARSVFKLMYDDGLIYRGERIVNWCPGCHSTLADDEVEYKTQKAKLYTFKYAKDFPFAIATTRPETKLGDTAVAVNAKDKRYKKYIGRIFEADFVGVKLKIKIIADRGVDMEFGTGALGVTPAHSAIDWQMAEENDLKVIKVINEEGKIKNGFGEYSGLDVLAARQKIVENLKKAGLMEKEEEIENNLSLCYRCDTPIEPLPSRQWFINVNKPLKNQKSKIKNQNVIDWEGKSIKDVCLEVVRDGKIKIIPKRFEKNYFYWMENLRDWCVSRQIWFGHRVPVWYRKNAKILLTLVRHGQTDWNKNGIMQGQKDVPLNGNGEAAAKKLAEKIKDEKFDVIITSPLKRTSQTAELLNSYGARIIEDDRLKERGYGKFEGMKTSEVLKKHPEIKTFKVNGLPYWIDVPTAETYDQVKARVKDFIEDVKTKYAGKKILVVSHGDTLDMFYAVLNDLPNEKAYGRYSLNMRLEKYELAAGDEEVHVGINPPKGAGPSSAGAAAGKWIQDEDTLDTWFSSGLWTFSALAHNPDEISIKNGRLEISSDDFKNFHPTSVLETGYDILFFWVARMIIMTTYAVGDIPFRDVYLHGLVRDEQGRKMSKSLGNVIDPLEMIKKYGTDATRLSLVIGTAPGGDMNLSEEKIAGYRNFVNKLWNISRYIMQNDNAKLKIKNLTLTLVDQWILGKMENLIKSVSDDLDNYRFSQAGEKLRVFTWDYLADWYLEASKFEKENKAEILNLILRDLLKLWHPFIPFVTEVIWSNRYDKNLLIIEQWPEAEEYEKLAGRAAGSEFEIIKNIIIAVRNARAENKVEPARKIKAVIYAGKDLELVKSQAVLLKSLRTGLSELEIKKSGEKIDDAISVSVNGIEIYLIGAIDKEKEKARVEKEIVGLEKAISASEKKLKNKEFIKKAPKEVVKAEQNRLKQRKEDLAKLKAMEKF